MTLRLPRRSDVVLGKTVPFLPWSDVRLNRKEQGYHATIWGQTGSGKSRLLQSVFLQHLRLGTGVCLIDPHHDLAYDTVCSLKQQGFFTDPGSYEKLIYIDWGNGAYVPFNILARNSVQARLNEPEVIAGNVLDSFLRCWPELQQAPTFQTLFTASCEVLIANELPMTFLYQLLADRRFRLSCLQAVSDPLIHLVFQTFDKTRDQVNEAGSTLRRAYLVSHDANCRYTLGQRENWLNVRSIMDSGKSMIIDLGAIQNREVRRLIGALLLVSIEQAALSRTDLLPQQRRPFVVLVDEWQEFAAHDTISDILSQTRKYNLRLYLATQSSTGIESVRLERALENCRLTIVFGVGRYSAKQQAEQIGTIDFASLKEEAKTQSQHNLFQTVPEQFEAWAQDLQNMDSREAYVKLVHEPAQRMRTVYVPDHEVGQDEIADVLHTYRQMYQREKPQAQTAVPRTIIADPLPAMGDTLRPPLSPRKRRGVE